MSFSNAYTLAAERGINPEDLKVGNPADEATALAILTHAIPERLAEAWGFLSRLAPAVKASGQVWDDCLHCTVGGKGALAAAAKIAQTPGLAVGGLIHYTPEQQKAIMAQLPRLAMFDVPRQLVWDNLGIWLEHLFAKEVFIISPTPDIDLNAAFQRHAVRLRWTGKGTAEPDTQSVAESRQTVEAILAKYRHGWRHLEQFVASAGESGNAIVLDTSNTEAIADDLHHLVGSVTGRALVNERFGRVFSYYNCHAPSTGPAADPKTGKPKTSAVLQLRNQHPELEHC